LLALPVEDLVKSCIETVYGQSPDSRRLRVRHP
jgi:hypothetical protein